MKKYLLLLAAFTLALASCNRNQQEADAFSVKTITVEDSVHFPAEMVEEWMDDDMARYLAVVDVPETENEDLRDNIINWISGQLNENYDGDSQDVNAMVEYDKNEFLSFETGSPRSYLENFIKMAEDNDRYVSYSCEGWIYMGGAHGTSFKQGATFNKTNGERFTYKMFKNPDLLTELIKSALEKQYFEPLLEGNDITFEQAVYSEVAESFPLSEAEPWIRNDSVIFNYADYEIAAHVFGLPECGIPYEKLKNDLTDEGKAFFEPVKK